MSIDGAPGEISWTAAMRAGDFARAWQISDSCLRRRLRDGVPPHTGPRHLQYVWTGAPVVDKHVLVRCYHGLGDTIQFIRLAAPLRHLARKITVWAQPELISLVSTAAGVDRVLPLHDGAPDVDYDAEVEIMELAHLLRVDLDTLPCAVPYLFPKGHTTVPAHGSDFAVGVLWQAGDWDVKRSLPAEMLAPLRTVSRVRLLSLQHGRPAADAARIPVRSIASDDIETLAATLRGLDLLVTVDTFVAHLGGALGVRTWLLLHADADWRWMDSRRDSPWYPTMRLFRQTRRGDWTGVIAEVATALRSLTASSRKVGTNDCL